MNKSLIEQYVELIINNLPKFNYKKGAFQREKLSFKKEAFKIDATLSNEEQLTELGKIIEKHIPDNHINIITKEGAKVNRDIPLYQNNIAYQPNEMLTRFKISNKDGINGCFYLGTKKIAGKNVGVVSIPSFFHNGTQEQDDNQQKFIDAFFKMKKEQKWTDIIFDFRGNYGGDATIIKEIAERLSGKEVFYSNTTKVITPYPLYQEHKKAFAEKEHTIDMPSFTKKQQEGDAFNGEIYILQDRCNASSAEGAIFMLSQLKNVTTIGENTFGAFQGGATVELKMPYGSLLIGTEYRERFSKKGEPILEKEGIKPDIFVISEKAFETAVSRITAIETQKRNLSNNEK